MFNDVFRIKYIATDNTVTTHLTQHSIVIGYTTIIAGPTGQTPLAQVGAPIVQCTKATT